ncbi:MAG: tetratricopeptide repeat protein, partial [Candidatus Latescibacteria bacterium]|nr:tetratricopeptide repeat protein [Candidatus Latescibacterota bacterium]
YRPAPVLLVILTGIVLYANSFDCSFHLDDYDDIINNHAIRNLHDIGGIWEYMNLRFVGYLTFALNYHFNRLDVSGYHLVNLLVHIGASLSVLWLVRLILSTPVMRARPVARASSQVSLGCALIFLAHPLQTQAVTYIVQRLASLAALFYLLSLCCYFTARLTVKKGAAVWFAGSVVFAGLAFFTKESSFTLPVAVVLCELYFFRGSKERPSGIKHTLPAFLTIAFLFAAPAAIIPGTLDFNRLFQAAESQRHGDPPLTILTYPATQLTVIPRYIRLLLLPAGQNIDHDVPAAHSFLETPPLAGLVFLLTLFSCGVALFRRSPLVSFGILWFFLTLSVESSLKPLANVMFEHRLYLPMVGFSLVLVGGLHRLTAARSMSLFRALLIIIVAVFSLATVRRNTAWKNETTLWSDAAAKSPGKSRPYHYLGLARQRKGDIEGALAMYRRALEKDPGNAESLANIGLLRYDAGRYDEAAATFRKALGLKPSDAAISSNLGNALVRLKCYDEAVKAYRAAILNDPDNSSYQSNLGHALLRSGRIDEAIAAYREAVRLTPESASLQYRLGEALRMAGKNDEALAAYRRAIGIDPSMTDACLNAGNVYFMQNDFDHAIEWYTRGLETNPGYGALHKNIGIAYLREGRKDDAVRHLERAAELLPESTELRVILEKLRR